MSDNDPTAGGAWNDGCDFAMTQLCLFLGVNQNDVRWDAATETVDGDVQAVIGNILRAKFGEDWGPDDTFAPAQPEKMPTSRPVAFRVPRVVDDKLSKTEFRLFDDEDEARRAACDIGADYDRLFLVADRRAAFFAQPDPRLSAGNASEIASVVSRLRNFAIWNARHSHYDPVPLCKEAADLIERLTAVPQQVSVTGLAERIADVVMMLDAPDAYNRAYIAAVCRSILSQLSRPHQS